ncbi:uncharacterized protein LOC120375811 isoform X1 [Mauremys reevesii]|uniref:uncharacterized protein LOC120375811 isoform X1 n=1 Tax=Mauremys reevesii TaxID=260615 RepID=UPI001940123A|nr:uncharacterized protein LOC120375811 isoform X1 [Mauremys reevesii]
MDVPRPEVHQRGLHPNWRHCFRSEACPDQALDLPRWLACGCETGSGKWKSRRKGQNCTDVGIPAVGRLWMPQSALESCRRGDISCSDFVNIILLVGSHAKFPLLPSTCKGNLRSTLRDGKQQAYRAQFKEMSFPILFAVHLLLGVSQAFPFCINQLRLKRGVKSKAQPLLIFSIAHCLPAALHSCHAMSRRGSSEPGGPKPLQCTRECQGWQCSRSSQR